MRLLLCFALKEKAVLFQKIAAGKAGIFFAIK
jgi:hypothetical protein